MFRTNVLRVTVLLLALVFVLVACTDVTTTLTTNPSSTSSTLPSTITTTKPTTSPSSTTTTTEAEEVFVLLNQSSASLKVGATVTLTAEMTDLSVPTFVWSSTDETVATVENGVVTALKSGTSTIRVTVGELYAECTISVTDVIDLIFTAIPETAFVGEQLTLDIVARVNGIDTSENIVIDGVGFTKEALIVTFTESGVITIQASYPGAESIERSITVYYEVASSEDFSNINNDLNGYYLMTSDIDLGGNPLNTVAHYSSGHSSSTSGFNGTFDGNGHTIMNFYAYYANDLSVKANSSPFGLIGSNGIVKNTNFMGVEIKTRIAGGIATINYGLIENCFAQVHVTYDTSSDVNNPMGGLVSKNYGRITHSVAYVTMANNISTTNIGGVVGRTLNGSTITNSYSISAVGKYEEAIPTNGDMLGEFTNFDGYATINDFYAGADLTGFNSSWNFTEGYVPHLGDIIDEITITNTITETYAGTPIQLEVIHEFPVTYRLGSEIDGVSISQTGFLTIDEIVLADSVITVIVSSIYGDVTNQIVITILENNYSITSDETLYHFEWIKGVSDSLDQEALHGIEVFYNGDAFLNYSLVSTNEEVAIVTENKIIATGDGEAKINVVIDGIILYSIDVTSAMYNPVYTTEDFLAIGTDLSSLSSKYLLMNDLDFQDTSIKAFSSYKTKNGASGFAFSGYFDGQNYTISNFSPQYNTLDASDRDRSLFGFLTSTAVVKNINFTGVIGDDRTSVISNWNEGTIQNIYVEMLYISAVNNNRSDVNPAGVVVSKNRLGGVVENCITVLAFTEGATANYLGGVVGSNSGTVTNALTISMNPVVTAIYKPYAEGTVTNALVYPDLVAFNLDALTDTFGTNWVFAEGYYPHLLNLTETITLSNTTNKIYLDSSLQLVVNAKYGVFYSVTNEEAGISISPSGLLTITDEVALGTKITVVIKSHFGVATYTTEFEVVENNFTVERDVEHFDFTWVQGVSPITDYQAPLGLTIKNNGELYLGLYDIVISNDQVVKVEDGQVIALSDGTATIEIKIEGQTLVSFTVTSDMYLPVSTLSDFYAIGASTESVKQKYMLMNDLDFEGQGLPTIAHYSAGYTSGTNGFAGVFDGNGYSIRNYYSYYKNDLSVVANSSVFGTVASSGIIRNINFTQVLINSRISGAIATMNYGTIENCFVEVHVTWNTTSDINNPMGGIAAKNYGVIRNSVVVMTVEEGIALVNIGGIVGRTYADSLTENCFIIGPVGIYESAAVSGGMLGTFTNVEAYATLSDFYASEDLSSFNDDWEFAINYYPHLDKLSETINILNFSNKVYPNLTNQINLPNQYTVEYSLLSPVVGVTLSKTGQLVIDETVAIGTEITVIVKSLYLNLEDQMTFIVSEYNFDVTTENDLFIFDWIKNHSPLHEHAAAIGLNVTIDGEYFNGVTRFETANPNIAIVEDDQIIATGDGLTQIYVYANDTLVKTLTVDSTMYLPITTIAEFEAISTNQITLSYKYMLMNDLDYQGTGLATIAHYSAGYTSNVKGFSGVFDGNGYSIMNFYAYYKASLSVVANSSPFGTVAATGVIRNTNFTGVLIKTRIAGGIATINYGTIENCFVEVHITYNSSSEVNNPIGGVAGKNYGTIRNTVVILTAEPGIALVNIGGIVGRTYTGSVTENSFIIGPVGINESATPSGGMLGTNTNALAFETLEAFYASADLLSFNETWTFEPNNYPFYGEFDGTVTITNSSYTVAQNSSLQLTVNSPYHVVFSLQAPVEGVSITASGLLTVSQEVLVDTTVVIVVTSIFDSAFTESALFTVIAPSIE